MNETATKTEKSGHRDDASRKEVMLYAFGNIEASIADQFFTVLQSVMVVAMHVSPLILGFVLAIKTFWDSITDPIMAHITDNTRSRWGRRRPYILVGGVSRIALLVFIVAFIPRGAELTTNVIMEAQKSVNDAVAEASKSQIAAVQTYQQIGTVDLDLRQKMLDLTSRVVVDMGWARQALIENLPILRDDLAARREEAAQKREAYEGMGKEAPGAVRASGAARGIAEAAEDKATRAQALVDKGIDAQRRAIAAGYAALHILVAANLVSYQALATPALAQQAADRAYAEARLEPMDIFVKPSGNPHGWQPGLKHRRKIADFYAAAYALYRDGVNSVMPAPTPEFAQRMADHVCAAAALKAVDIFSAERPPPPAKHKALSMIENIRTGAQELTDPRNAEQRRLIVYVLIALLLFTTLTTVQSVPYYALGIELSPSYDGRTQVVTYRAIMNKIAGLVQPWVPVFCFSLLFTTALQGLFWVAIFACVIGIPSTILMCWFIRERTHFTPKKKDHPGLFRSMWAIARNTTFLRIFALYTLIGMTTGTFMTIGFYLNIYWVMGSALSGAKLGAYIQMIAWGLGLCMLPVINWGCRRFEKHRFMRFAIVWMSIGAALHWWCMNPDHPEYQLFLPFFYSVGIGTVFTVLPTLMADVTDLDELRYGVRREGMFGAVMAFLMKLTGTLTPILAGLVLVTSGFDPSLECEQLPSTITRLRLLYSFVPAGLLLTALLVLIRYPLTRGKVAEIKEALRVRHEQDEENTEAIRLCGPVNFTTSVRKDRQ